MLHKLSGLSVLMILSSVACSGATADDTSDTEVKDSAEDTDVTLEGCNAPLVSLQTGQDSTCSGGNEHVWPVGMGDDYCHGWGATDNSGDSHQNSASAIQCNEDGSFSFNQYAGNLTCSGDGVSKTFYLDVCEQDIPPVLYSIGTDLACCLAPESDECKVGMPSVSVSGGQIFLNGEACEE